MREINSQEMEKIRMKNLTTPFRYDYVGSFLRPEKLKKARADFEAGKITKEQLKEVEDACILELVAKIKELGYHVITDGEFRRATWHLDFMWGFDGIEHKKTVDGNTTFDGEAAMIDDTFMVGKISIKNHPFVDHFKFVKALEDENTIAKQTVPSPAQFYAYFTGAELLDTTLEIYGTEEAFAEDVIRAYGEFIEEIYAAGCRNLQFDDCVWGGLVNPKLAVALTGRRGEALEEYKKVILALNNKVVEEAPADLIINTHVCRGNYHSTFFSSGAYDGVADLLFGEENVNAYYLEYDDERSGGFAPLAKITGNKKVVLGLVTTKTPKFENKQSVIARIKEASKYVPLENLYLSPQCGFASCEIGNKLTEEEQWAKLKLVKEIAEEVWEA
jgi:5-methyltetrahydropteroyltriglutamate--homocysteine methyltransferase